MERDFIIITAVTMLVLGTAEYLICGRTERTWIRFLLYLWPLLWAVSAAMVIFFRLGDGGWLDLSAFFAFFMAVYAAGSAFGTACGYLLYRLRIRSAKHRS